MAVHVGVTALPDHNRQQPADLVPQLPGETTSKCTAVPASLGD
jgi:hypothetical protein